MPRTILIVEDNPEEREIVSTYLEFVGERVVEAPNGAEGLRLAREHHPDLILLDLTMPVMDGWEMVRRLQQDPELKPIPVLAVTAHHPMRSMLQDAGFRGSLEKPLAPFRILREVERCIGSPCSGEHPSPPERPLAAGLWTGHS